MNDTLNKVHLFTREGDVLTTSTLLSGNRPHRSGSFTLLEDLDPTDRRCTRVCPYVQD